MEHGEELVQDLLTRCSARRMRFAEVYLQTRYRLTVECSLDGTSSSVAVQPGVAIRGVDSGGGQVFLRTSGCSRRQALALLDGQPPADRQSLAGGGPQERGRLDELVATEVAVDAARTALRSARDAAHRLAGAVATVSFTADSIVVGSTGTPPVPISRRTWRMLAEARVAEAPYAHGTGSWAGQCRDERSVAALAGDTGRRAAEQAGRLVPAVEYDGPRRPAVVFGAGAAGTLFHETVGHGLEGDTVVDGASALARTLGDRIAIPQLHVTDAGAAGQHVACEPVDDEGTPVRDTALVRDGAVAGWVSSRASASACGRPPTGHARRESYARPATCRMRHTLVGCGTHREEELIAATGDGIYVTALSGGDADPRSGRFSFGVREAYRIEGGRVGPVLRPFSLTGETLEFLGAVRAVGDRAASGHVLCRKDGQLLLVAYTTPALLAGGLAVLGNSRG